MLCVGAGPQLETMLGMLDSHALRGVATFEELAIAVTVIPGVSHLRSRGAVYLLYSRAVVVSS